MSMAIGIFIAIILLFGIPAICYKFGPKIGKGGAETMAFMWMIFASFPCAAIGMLSARALRELLA